MTTLHTADFTISTSQGEIEANGEFDVTYSPAMFDYGDTDCSAEFLSCKFGDLTIYRDMLVDILSNAEVQAIEAIVAENYTEEDEE